MGGEDWRNGRHASLISLFDHFGHIPFPICVAIAGFVLECPVVGEAILIDCLQRGIAGIYALFERGAKLNVDIRHRSLRVLGSDGVLAVSAPCTDASIDLCVVVSPRCRRKRRDQNGGGQQCCAE